MESSAARFYAFRLGPHADLKASVLEFAKAHSLKAGVVISCVGSLEEVNIRFANRQYASRVTGYHEILTLSGTLSETSLHLHIALADRDGQVTGGHLLDGNLIYTTAEITIADLTDYDFHREVDPAYGYHELIVRDRLNPSGT